MQDRTILVITTLAEMLQEQSQALTEERQGRNAAVEGLVDIGREVEDLKLELQSAYRRCTQLEDELSYQRRQGLTGATHGHAMLFQAFIKDPEKMMDAIAWLRARSPQERTQKIAMIKEVRSIAHLGLKEAKDLVEAFLEYPTSAPGAPMGGFAVPVSLQDGGPLDHVGD